MESEESYSRVLRADALADTSAVVTGAGSGIGRAIALRLTELGSQVTGIARHEEPLAETARLVTGRGSYDYVTCDIRDHDAAATAVGDIGRTRGLDLLVNNAGGQFVAPAVDITPGGWNAVIDLNLNSVFNLTKAAYPYLAERSGAVINLSLSGVERGGMGVSHSIAARAGVLGMTRSLALEWAKAGIRLNCVGPGTVLTPALDSYATDYLHDELIGKATPMRRPTPAADVAELVAFLASPAGRLMTGQLLQIDGGAHLGPGLHMLAAT